MNFGELITTKTFMAGFAKALTGVAGVVSGIFICVGTLGGGTPVGAAVIIAGIYGISDGIASMAQRNATGKLEAKVDAAMNSALPNVTGVPADVIRAAAQKFGQIIADHAPKK